MVPIRPGDSVVANLKAWGRLTAPFAVVALRLIPSIIVLRVISTACHVSALPWRGVGPVRWGGPPCRDVKAGKVAQRVRRGAWWQLIAARRVLAVIGTMGRSTRHWKMIKQRLAFMTATQDGDEEGCLRLFRLPTPEEAALIREALLLRKRRTLTEESRASLIAAGVNGRFRARRAATAPGLVPDAAPTLVPEKTATISSINAAAVTEPEEVA